MKQCNVNDLRGGEILAKPILTDGYQILLGEGTKLQSEYIAKIIELGIRTVTIRNLEFQEVQILKQETEDQFRNKVKNILERHTYSNNSELRQLSDTADSLITNILQEEEVISKVYDIRERSSDLYEHSISVCSLAILTALKLKMKPGMVHDIGVACLLHDLGLRYLAIDYEDKSLDEMNEADQSEFKKHPVYAYSALKEENWLSDEVKNMILYHHEKMDGTGYPLHARMLTLESRVLNLCDTFDEMICGMGCKRRKVSEAIQQLKQYRNIRYDGRILDAFLTFTAVYPVGTLVLTNRGEVARIVRQNNQSPDRPVLRIVKDKNGNLVVNEMLRDMMADPDLYIEKAIES